MFAPVMTALKQEFVRSARVVFTVIVTAPIGEIGQSCYFWIYVDRPACRFACHLCDRCVGVASASGTRTVLLPPFFLQLIFCAALQSFFQDQH